MLALLAVLPHAALPAGGAHALQRELPVHDYLEMGSGENMTWSLTEPKLRDPNICGIDTASGKTKAVPSLFLLGGQKCGSTSFAKALRDAGVQMMNQAFKPESVGEKEWHFFDGYCAGASPSRAGTCVDVVVDDAFRLEFANRNDYECEQKATVCDASPDNVRLVGLPRVLIELYASSVAKLSFVVMLREPIARMQSDFYYCRELVANCTPFGTTTFGAYADELLLQLPDNYTAVLGACGDHTRTSVACKTRWGKDLSFFYTSLYFIQMREWLDEKLAKGLKPYQFSVLPSGWAVDHTHEALRLMSEQFPGVHLNLSAIPTEGDHLMSGNEHPLPEDDLNPDTLKRLKVVFFEEDALLLSMMLSNAMKSGLTLGGYNHTDTYDDTPLFAESVKNHLEMWWNM
jgi:hypothetical protein